MADAVVAQLVERVLGKDEVTSSILVNGSRISEVVFVRDVQRSGGKIRRWNRC